MDLNLESISSSILTRVMMVTSGCDTRGAERAHDNQDNNGLRNTYASPIAKVIKSRNIRWVKLAASIGPSVGRD
jgi:hypothetical protein